MNLHLLLGDINPAMADRFYRWVYGPDQVTSREILLSSGGGDVGLMTGMFDTVIEHDIPIVATGVVQSAAAVLFQAGHRRYMYPNSLLRFHEMPRDSKTDDMSDPDWFIFTKLVALVRQRTGIGLAEVHDLFDGSFIDAPRAIELGLCDEIRNGGPDGNTSGVPSSEGQDLGEQADLFTGWPTVAGA